MGSIKRDIIICIIAIITLIALSIALFVFTPFPQNTLIGLIGVLPLIPFSEYLLFYYLLLYPSNTYYDYRIIIKKDLDLSKNEIIGTIDKYDCIYVVNIEGKKYYFNMGKCIFPIRIITSYFVKEIKYLICNTYKLTDKHMYKILKLDSKTFNNLTDFYLVFENKKYYIVKNKKTKFWFVDYWYNVIYNNPLKRRGSGYNHPTHTFQTGKVLDRHGPSVIKRVEEKMM